MSDQSPTHHPSQTDSTSPHQREGFRCARGTTLLEAVLATVLLAMVAGTLASAVSFATMSQRRMAQRLGAAELANRLMLQHIDDPDSLPSDSLAIEYDIDLYRWSMDIDPVVFDIANPQEESDSGGIGAGVSFERVKLVSVKVWLDEESGGSRSFSPNAPNAQITRLIDPLALSNPDSLTTILEDPEKTEKFFQRLLDANGGG